MPFYEIRETLAYPVEAHCAHCAWAAFREDYVGGEYIYDTDLVKIDGDEPADAHTGEEDTDGTTD